MGWNWSPSRNFFSHCFDEFQRDGEIGRAFSRTSGWNFDVQENKKKSTPEELVLAHWTSGVHGGGG